MKKIIAFIMFIGLFSSPIASQAITFDSLQKKVQRLEDSLKVQGKTVSTLKEASEIYEKTKETFGKPWWQLVLEFGVLAAALGLTIWNVRKFGSEKLTTEIEKLIVKRELTNVVKDEKTILVVSASDTKPKFWSDFLEEFKFKEKSEYLHISKLALDKRNFNILVVHDEDTNSPIDQKVLETYMKEHTKTCMFYFNSGQLQFVTQDTNVKRRVSFAKAYSQVYGNLISLMKYHNMVAPKRDIAEW